MRNRIAAGVVALVAAAGMMIGMTVPAGAGPLPPTFEVVSVNTLGCNSGNFGMTVERANLVDETSYTVRTVVNGADGLIYMNENASISVNGESGWNLFNNFTYGSVWNPGTWPIPEDMELEIDFTLEQPLGTVLYEWTLVVDGCNTGEILYNGLSSGFPPATTTTTTSTTSTTSTVAPTTAAPTAAAPAAVTVPRFTG